MDNGNRIARGGVRDRVLSCASMSLGGEGGGRRREGEGRAEGGIRNEGGREE